MTTNRPPLPYLIVVIALLAAAFGAAPSGVLADRDGHHDGGHKHEDKDRKHVDDDRKHGDDANVEVGSGDVDISGGDRDDRKVDDDQEQKGRDDGSRHHDDDQGERRETGDNMPVLSQPTSTPKPKAPAQPSDNPAPQSVESGPPVPIIDPAAYRIAVKCKYYGEQDYTACRFSVKSRFGGMAADHAIMTSAVCTEVMAGEVPYVDYDPATRTAGFRFYGPDDRMVLVGRVAEKGHARYAVQVGAEDFKLTGPGLACGVSREDGAQVIVSKYVCAVPADDPRAGESPAFVPSRNEPFQAPDGTVGCRAAGEGEGSFTLDYVDGVRSPGGLPTHANGRVRFTSVTAGEYRLVERASHARSRVFALSGQHLVLYRVIDFVPDQRASH